MVSAQMPKPRPPRVALWVTERELGMIAAKFAGFHGSLADAIHEAHVEARKARTEHNRALRNYRHSRREGDE